MAEFSHTFIDSRSFNALSLLIPCPSHSKSFLHSPRILTRRKTSSRNRLTVSAKSTSPTSSSPPLDVISTSEHSDGSILFRFGDASEVARTGELDTSSSSEKSLTREVLDGQQENHVIDKEIENKVTRDSSNKIDETLPLSANDVTEFGQSSETTHERGVPASEVIDSDTNGSSGSEDHQGDSASEVCDSSSTEVVLVLQETDESGVVNYLTGAHDVPQLDENGYIEKSGSALLEILEEGSKGESAPSLNMLSVLNSKLASGSAGESSSIDLNDTTEVHESEDHLADASLNFEYEEAIGLSDIIAVAPESKVDGAESVLDQEVRGDMPGELLDKKELLLSQPILVEEVSHEPEAIEIVSESKVVVAESVLNEEVNGDMSAELLDTKELLLSQPILVEEVSYEPEVIEIVPESKVVGDESVLNQEVSGDMSAELLDTKELLLSQPILVEEVSHEPEGIEVAPESKVVGDESVLDQEIRGNMPTELLDTKELLLSQPILVEEVSHEQEGIEVVPESKVDGAESVLDQVVIGGMPGELLVTKEPLSQHILVEEVIHEPKGIEGVESAFDQEVSSDIPAELLDTKELLSQPILVEEVSHEPEESLETIAYEQSQIYVAAANETDDVQKNGSTRSMDPAEFVKTEETDLVESLGHGLFKRETVDTHCSEQTNDLISPAETKTEEIPGENKNLVEPSVQTTISREEMPREAYVMHCGVSLFPHPKALTGGEDAYFVAGSWFGVADGVSDWSMEGTSPGIYARELMEKCANITSNNSGTSPVDVLNRSVNESQSRGLSTILVAHFDGQVLHVANIGDSRIIVIRNNSIYKTSLPMQHEFNFPLLIGNGHNSFKFAEEYMIELDDGDVVITATDGLFDNVYEEEIESIISKSLQAKSKPQEIAEILAWRAQEVGKSVSCRSPFGDEAIAAGYVRYGGGGGGKLDDITVIVSMVKTNISHGL